MGWRILEIQCRCVKFTFSEKATKIDKIFTINLTVCYVVTVKSTVKIPSIFVAFLENMNFTKCYFFTVHLHLPISISTFISLYHLYFFIFYPIFPFFFPFFFQFFFQLFFILSRSNFGFLPNFLC